jgi:acetolactate synthase-1/2/3 large subunit
MDANGGHLAAEVLARQGVTVAYTLSGGHIFPLYDGCVQRQIRLVDVRHEQTAGFAAEGHAKLTGDVGVAFVTAGPGVTNAISPITSAQFNGAPVLVLAGRAPQARWGRGSLQELDHVPIVASITKSARTVFETSEVATAVDEALRAARTPHRGPTFLDVPLDTMFLPGEAEVPEAGGVPTGAEPDPDAIKAAGRLLAGAERPVIVAGSDVWFGRAWEELTRLAETVSAPVVTNGMGRGCVPADHALAISRARSFAFREADLVMVVGTPLDFRIGFGEFAGAKVVHVQDDEAAIGTHASPAAAVAGDLRRALDGICEAAAQSPDRSGWVSKVQDEEHSRRQSEQDDLNSEAHPIHPARVYGVLREKLDRDAVVICDGGDFVSFAGKYIDCFTPGAWLDPGPYGCLGTGLGYAIAARVVHPDRQVVLMLGDGAAGFSLMDFDTLVRHNLPVVAIVGNNGIWGLEKHPMKALYGYDVAADLRQDTRYDDLVAALGGAGETVEKASELPNALDRGFEAGVPYLINVLTDPEAVYPRSANLA